MSTITIKLHAHLREKAGVDQYRIEVPNGITVRELKDEFLKQFPRLRPQLANVVTMVNRKSFYLEEEALPEQAEVSFMPPIGGG